jgi:hypothetical protein
MRSILNSRKELEMNRCIRPLFLLLVFILASGTVLFADEEAPEIDFNFGIGIGSRTFNEADGEKVTYQSFALTPELTVGKFGLGLNITLNFNFTGGPENNQFEIRREDWVPDSAADFLPIYLPKFKYIRWAEKGEPLYILLGEIENGLLGNGFIMSNYTNTTFLPELPVFGLSFDLDGRLFNFPYVGIETFVGNLAVFDIIGSRLYVRPFAWTSSPILTGLQLGGTVAGDRKPYYYDPSSDAPGSVIMGGADIMVPLLTKEMFTLNTFGDLVFQQYGTGGMVGFGGRIVKILLYRAEIRFVGTNFIPVYFDATYDLYRHIKYKIYSGEETSPSSIGWYGMTGISVLDDRLSLMISLDGPFTKRITETVGGVAPEDNPQNYPHLRAVFSMSKDLFPIYLQASYDKQLIRSFSDLVSPERSTIQASLNFKMGPAVISLAYRLKNTPNDTGGMDIETSSVLESFISLF